MFPSWILFGNSLSRMPLLQQRQMSSEHRMFNQRWTVPEQVQARCSATNNDQKRPPFLLVKSFCNLRHMDTDYGEDVSRVTDQLNFQPHRTIFIEILQLSPPHHPDGTEAETRQGGTELPDGDQIPVPVSES